MSYVRVISDLHFNHRNMALRRGFSSVEAMNDLIICNWNDVVGKKDVTYILGDITMEKKDGYELLDELRGVKHVILGNHDRRQDVPELLKHVASVSSMLYYKKKFILTHCPIHPNELKYRWSVNIHGHVHENTIMKPKNWFQQIPDPRYWNVSAEVVDYTPQLILNE